MSCRTCKWLDVPPDKSGRIVVREGWGYPCVAPIEMPRWPACVTNRHGFHWPKSGSTTIAEWGENCPLFEPRPKKGRK